MSIGVLVIFVLGIFALFTGAEILVRGASGLARTMGISSLLIGLTVVSFGTSAPELSVSLISLLRSQADLSVGNVVGSNIANILLVLGASALVAPLIVSVQLVNLHAPFMIGASFLVLLVALDGTFDRLDGILLILGLILYTTALLRQQKKKENVHEQTLPHAETPARSGFTFFSQFAMITGGMILLVEGSGWLIEAATVVARSLGVSELVIGLTVVAGGTSLPELVTSIVAAFRGEQDIAIGNVVGSCILNLLLVLGAASVIAPNGIALNPAVLSFDLPVMIAVSLVCLLIFYTGHQIARWEGCLFLVYYMAYTLYLVLDAKRYSALPLLSGIMVDFVIPLTIIAILVLSVRARQRGHHQAHQES